MIFDLPPIPSYWTGEQALEVADFLEQIIHRIWWIHGDKMTRFAKAHPADSDPPPDSSNLPF